MTTVNANEIALGIESFGDDDAPLVLLAGGTTMLSWPDALCERLAAGGRRVVRYDLRDSGESTMTDPEAPAYTLRDLAADAAALAGVLGGGPAHLAGIGVGGMVAQVAVLDHPGAFSALTLAGTRAVAPGPPDDDLPDHDQATMSRLFAHPLPDWTDREAVAEFAAAGAEILGGGGEDSAVTGGKEDPQGLAFAAKPGLDQMLGCQRLLRGPDGVEHVRLAPAPDWATAWAGRPRRRARLLGQGRLRGPRRSCRYPPEPSSAARGRARGRSPGGGGSRGRWRVNRCWPARRRWD
ncbi:alpha/beta fold hydrolase [Streptomyces sp. NBC_01320]|uniref:alpha/beta fold hydrolase n=1 Tax=Streptomyces sp. NBC_01320 TaxID=2903824 RepID=UPI002E1554A9|nr:alpha/beta fold hydrolase [Streptomyces sp. NBC_01320]